MTEPRSPAEFTSRNAATALTLALAAAAAAVAASAAGCVSDAGLLIILQNQQPVLDDVSHVCVAGSTPSATAVGSGVLDLETGVSLVYKAYPLVQSSLPPRAATAGATDPNTVNLEGVRGTLFSPPGLTIAWPAGCPAEFFWPSTAALLPGTSQGLTVQVVRPCQADLIHALFASGALPSDFSQQIMFTVEMRAVGRVAGGGEISSDAFRFAIRMCIGCLQTNFPQTAQFNWPARPPCSIAPKPNLYLGNLCNPAQDYGPLLCCTDDMSRVLCPAPGS
jgi:hypothetical protein